MRRIHVDAVRGGGPAGIPEVLTGGRGRLVASGPFTSRAMTLFSAAAFVLASLLGSATASAHPHIFFDLELGIAISAGPVMTVRWTLFPNEATCAAMFMEADIDGDNAVSDDELKQLSETWNGYFSRFEYFATARSDSVELPAPSCTWTGMRVLPRQDDFPFFSLSFEARFDLPERKGGDHAVETDLSDRTFYAAFFQKKDAFSLETPDRRVGNPCFGILKHGRGVTLSYKMLDKGPADRTESVADSGAVNYSVKCGPQAGKSLRARFNETLRAGIDRLSSKVLSLSKHFQAGVFFAFMGFALLYGMFHALGPGHGKALVAAFLMRGNGKPRHALLLALVVAITHTGMAVVIAVAIKLAGAGVQGEQYREYGQAWVGLASGLLVMLIGLFPSFSLIARRLFGKPALPVKGAVSVEPDPVTDPRSPAQSEYELTLARVGRWGVATGLVPCPASLVILFISIGAGVFWLGLLAVAALAVGLSTVLMVIGLGIVYSKRGILSRFSDSRRVAAAQTALSVASGLLVVVLGSLLVSFYADRLAALGAM